MLRLYFSDAIKSIRSSISLTIIIVLLFTFLIQILSYSFAWVTYNYWHSESQNTGMTNEVYLEYSVYSFQGGYDSLETPRVFISSLSLDETTGQIIERDLTQEEKQHNEAVFASYDKLNSNLKNIDGYFFSNRKLSGIIADDDRAYKLTTGYERGRKRISENELLLEQFLDIGYSIEDVEHFCQYDCFFIDRTTILMEGFVYSEGEGFTEQNLNYDYVITEDGHLPTVPIVMGNDFREYFDIGDVLNSAMNKMYINGYYNGIQTMRFSDQHNCSYIVVGFLEKDSSVEYRDGVRMNVDSYFIIPEVPNTPEYFPNDPLKSQIDEFYKRIPRSIAYIEKENETKIVDSLAKALSEDTVIGPYFHLVKNEHLNAVYGSILEKRAVGFGAIAISTFGFCIAVIIIIIINKFNSGIKDTAIHRLIGASTGDIVRTYVLEFAIYLLCADILSHYVYIIYAFNPMSRALIGFWSVLPVNGVDVRMIYPLMLVMNVVFLAIVALIAYICSSKLDTAEIIKGKE